jgi:Ca2+-binding EF-hand superfamily protein
MKTTQRILVSSLVLALGLPIALQAAKADKQKPATADDAFAKADTDKDGSVSQTEFAASMGGKGGKGEERAKKGFSRLDKNGDGKLSKEEFAAAAERKKKNDA